MRVVLCAIIEFVVSSRMIANHHGRQKGCFQENHRSVKRRVDEICTNGTSVNAPM